MKWKLAGFCYIMVFLFLRGKSNSEFTSEVGLQQAFKNRSSVYILLFYTFKVNNNNNKWKGQITEIHQKKKMSLIAMTGEFNLPLEGCHENLSAKFKVKSSLLNERDLSFSWIFHSKLNVMCFLEIARDLKKRKMLKIFAD